MANLGKFNKLEISKVSDVALYLDADDYGSVILPKDQVEGEYKQGDTIDVFLYSDSQRKAIATTIKPKAQVGGFYLLKVAQVLEMGAFLDWGLPKDLFVPAGEQKEPMAKDEEYVVYVYMDEERDRVAASSRLDNYLDQEESQYKENDEVDLMICHATDLGINAIVDGKYWGLLYSDEIFQSLDYGQRIKGYIKQAREDGKIDLVLQKLRFQKLEALEEKIIEQINANNGILKITDKSDPDLIYETFGVSKKKFKASVGALYKAKRILISEEAITLVK